MNGGTNVIAVEGWLRQAASDLTTRPVRPTDRAPGFYPGNEGSTPSPAAKTFMKPNFTTIGSSVPSNRRQRALANAAAASQSRLAKTISSFNQVNSKRAMGPPLPKQLPPPDPLLAKHIAKDRTPGTRQVNTGRNCEDCGDSNTHVRNRRLLCDTCLQNRLTPQNISS